MLKSITFIGRAFLLFLLSCPVCTAETEASFSGIVRNAASLSPVTGATVMIPGTKIGVAARPNGHFRIPLPKPGSYTVRISCVGYRAGHLEIRVGKDGVLAGMEIYLEGRDVPIREIVIQKPRNPLVENVYTTRGCHFPGKDSLDIPLELDFSSVKPNPAHAHGGWTVSLEANKTQALRLQLVDINGQICRRMRLECRKGRNDMYIAAGSLPSGMYLLQAEGMSLPAVAKLVLTR